MNESFNKFLKYINEKNIISLKDFEKHFHLNNYEVIEIIKTLCQNQYLIALGNDEYQATYKSKTYFKTSVTSWFISNWLSIVAIIISIIALFK